MGSTGSGSFSDYSRSKKSGAKNRDAGGAGGSSGNDRCKQAFTCVLEEVALCDFFVRHGTTPVAKTQLHIVLKDRLFAVTTNGIIVGALPTAFNYLAACLADEIVYDGVVTSSTSSPVPSVTADFLAR